MSLQEEQLPIDRAIVEALIAVWPAAAPFIEMRLERSGSSLGEFRHIFSSGSETAPSTPSDELYELTFRLDGLIRKHGRTLTGATYRATADDGDDEIRWNATYEYAA